MNLSLFENAQNKFDSWKKQNWTQNWIGIRFVYIFLVAFQLNDRKYIFFPFKAWAIWDIVDEKEAYEFRDVHRLACHVRANIFWNEWTQGIFR